MYTVFSIARAEERWLVQTGEERFGRLLRLLLLP
jgi:hypothetical protein